MPGPVPTLARSPTSEPVTSTHYQRLGVAPSASTEEIRAAYRTLAGRLHPDRVIDGSPAERALADRRMREVNEAWRVLADPVRRRQYDDSRMVGRRHTSAPTGTAQRSPQGSAVTATDDDDLVDVLPEMGPVAAGLFRHLPWVVALVVLGAIFVVSAYAGKKDPAPAPTANAGTCIDVQSGPTTTIVPCAGPHELRIIRRVPAEAGCPSGTEPRRLGTDGLVDCVVLE